MLATSTPDGGVLLSWLRQRLVDLWIDFKTWIEIRRMFKMHRRIFKAMVQDLERLRREQD